MQQNILEKHPEANLRVYAVWFNMLPGDSREGWDSTVLADARVKHFWDEDRQLGKSLVQPLDYPGPIVWDAYVVYEPEASSLDEPSGSGWTVIGETDKLEDELEPFLT